jgi:hypothetical protein
MKIGFTGHRDREADPVYLDILAAAYPGATWIHGAAKEGFDNQVDQYALVHRIACQRFRPQYTHFPLESRQWEAPYARNRQIVEAVLFMLALYDGREKGGTRYTVRYAEHMAVPVYRIVPGAATPADIEAFRGWLKTRPK